MSYHSLYGYGHFTTSRDRKSRGTGKGSMDPRAKMIGLPRAIRDDLLNRSSRKAIQSRQGVQSW